MQGADDVFGAPHITNVVKSITAIDPDMPEYKREMILKNAIQMYGLLPGQLWRHGENVHDMYQGITEPRKRKKIKRGKADRGKIERN